MDALPPGVPATHSDVQATGRIQLDFDVPERLHHRRAVREVAVLQRQRHRQGAAQRLLGQQDESRGLVRLQLRRAQRSPRLRQGIAEIHSGSHFNKFL